MCAHAACGKYASMREGIKLKVQGQLQVQTQVAANSLFKMENLDI